MVYQRVPLFRTLGRALGDTFGLGARVTGSRSFEYTIYAVPGGELRAFLRRHPDAVLSIDLYCRLLGTPGHQQSASELLAEAERIERQYPGRVCVCAGFDR